MEYDTTELPYVYIFTSIISVSLGFVYTKFEEKFRVKKLLNITFLFLVSLVVIFYLLIKFYDIKITHMAIMIFKDIIWMFAGIEFGILSGIIFDIRQGKRLFGLLMSGEILAGIIGGFSISLLLKYITLTDLLLFSSFSLLLSFVLLRKIMKQFSTRFGIKNSSDDEDESANLSYKTLLKNRYYLVFFAISLLSFLVFYFIDYVFYFEVEEHYKSEKELASFFGVFIAFLNSVNLISSLFISGKSLSRYGISFGILAIPVLAVLGTSSILITLSVSVGIAFALIIVVKLLNEVLDITILTPSFRIIYQSIPQGQRNKVLAFRETIIEPIAMGGAGLFLLGIALFQGIEFVYYLIIFFGIIWFILGKILTKQYLQSLKSIINKRIIFSNSSLLDSLEASMFLEYLRSDDDIKIIYAIESLEKINYDQLNPILKDLMFHKSERVQIYTLETIRKLEQSYFLELIETLLAKESKEEVISTALQTYGKILEVDAIEVIEPYLYSKSSIIKEGAIVSLTRYCGIDGVLLAGSVINRVMREASQESTLQILQILNHIGMPGYYDFLRQSLNSDNKKIKKLAIEVVGNLKIKRLLPILIDLLHETYYKAVIVQSIIKFEEGVEERIIDFYVNSKDMDKKRSFIKILASLKSKTANDFLIEQTKDFSVVDFIIEALFTAGYNSENIRYIETLLESNLNTILEILADLKSIDKESYPNTHKVINEAVVKKMENIFFVLGFLYPRNMIIQAKSNYKSSSQEKKALAVELLDNILHSRLKHSSIAILENRSIENKLVYFDSSYSMDMKDEQLLFDEVLSESRYLTIVKISLIYEIGLNGKREYQKSLQNCLKDNNADIKQTAMWALDKMKED